jgi:carboxymethylenebutenolidase
MKSQMINIKMQDGVCDAYVSCPEKAKNLPIVLVMMDAIGLRPRLHDMADEIAAQGYYVLAPNLFYRTRRAPVFDYSAFKKPDGLAGMWSEIRAVASRLNPTLTKKDVADFLKFAKAQPDLLTDRIGVVGYCMGGGQALRVAGDFPEEFKAVASFHAGGLATDLETSPHHWFKNIKAEVYIGHSDHDQSMPADQIARVTAELKAAHLKFTAELFKDCPHGWTMADLPAYNKAGEEKHWEKLFSLFQRNLKN